MGRDEGPTALDGFGSYVRGLFERAPQGFRLAEVTGIGALGRRAPDRPDLGTANRNVMTGGFDFQGMKGVEDFVYVPELLTLSISADSRAT